MNKKEKEEETLKSPGYYKVNPEPEEGYLVGDLDEFSLSRGPAKGEGEKPEKESKT